MICKTLHNYGRLGLIGDILLLLYKIHLSNVYTTKSYFFLIVLTRNKAYIIWHILDGNNLGNCHLLRYIHKVQNTNKDKETPLILYIILIFIEWAKFISVALHSHNVHTNYLSNTYLWELSPSIFVQKKTFIIIFQSKKLNKIKNIIFFISNAWVVQINDKDL